MTIRTESRLTIAGSIAEVWAYLCDVGRWPEWAPTVLECWTRDGDPVRPGARVEQRARAILGLTRHRSQRVTTVEAPGWIAFAGPMGTSAARWGMRFEPLADGQTVEANIQSLNALIGEKLELRRAVKLEGKIATYLHKKAADLPAQVGVLVSFEGDDADAARSAAMQVAALKAQFLTREDVPAETIESEKRIAEATARE